MNDEEKAMFEELFENAIKTNKEEAIKLWNSALGDAYRERMGREISFWPLCEEHLKHAREKHPFFADRIGPVDDSDAFYFGSLAEITKKRIKTEPSLEIVLMGEVHEFLAEMARGDLSRAREEAADIVAVLLRALSGDIKQEEKE